MLTEGLKKKRHVRDPVETEFDKTVEAISLDATPYF
jgi:hypothetical protein